MDRLQLRWLIVLNSVFLIYFSIHDSLEEVFSALMRAELPQHFVQDIIILAVHISASHVTYCNFVHYQNCFFFS